MSETGQEEHVRRLRRYYEDTWFDYRALWLDPRTRAMHFGYEQPGHRGHDASLLVLNAVMADRVGVEAGEMVLDAGCGVGGTSMWLAEVRGAHVVGINLVEDHVDRARCYAGERGLLGRVRFEVADYTSTGLQESSFDVVWAQESACHAPSKPALAAEAHRVLRPGGRLVMAEYLASDAASVDDPDMRTWTEAWEMTLESAETWTSVLTAAGFADIRIDDVTPRMVRSLRRLRRLCLVLWPIGRLLHVARVRTDTQQRNISGSLAMWRALRRDRWRYGLISATRP